MTVKYVDRGLVFNPLYVGLAITAKDFDEECNKLGITKPPVFVPEGCGACVHYLEKKSDGFIREIAIVCLKENSHKTKKIEAIHAMLVHEAMHVWRRCRQALGEDYPSSEFEAYSMQNLCQSIFTSYKKQVKALKKAEKKSK
jgi:hypothetical protein